MHRRRPGLAMETVWGAPSPPEERAAGYSAASPAASLGPVQVPRAPPPPPAPSAGRRCRLRNFNWERLPAERVLSGSLNLWTAAGRPGGFGLDLPLLEELFGQRPESAGGGLRGYPAEQVRGGLVGAEQGRRN